MVDGWLAIQLAPSNLVSSAGCVLGRCRSHVSGSTEATYVDDATSIRSMGNRVRDDGRVFVQLAAPCSDLSRPRTLDDWPCAFRVGMTAGRTGAFSWSGEPIASHPSHAGRCELRAVEAAPVPVGTGVASVLAVDLSGLTTGVVRARGVRR